MTKILLLCHFQGQFFAAQDMEVQVEYGLAGIGAAVTYHPVAAGEVFCLGDLGNNLKNVGHNAAVFRGRQLAGTCLPPLSDAHSPC